MIATIAIHGSQLLQEESMLLYPPPGKTFEGWSSSSTLGSHGRGARGGQEQGLGRLALGAIDGLDDLRFRPPRTQQLDGGLDLLPPRPGRSTSRAVLDQLDAFLSDFASQQTSAKPALLPARTG
ncbi:hypothetical protein HaLaN_16721 [Haematococcus lacustris]|uniref:Uncharacterized protein n=1 Tax=Haematococcus lacustris TaxID=44745 RepID=A0A699ZUU4_HAELA|nr:hypothetical protein HaLaN_16721 [Haematococcus lacustris]